MGINIRDRHIPVKHTYTPPVFDLPASDGQDGGMNNIASIRRLRGLNQAQLAEKVGVSQPHISRIEKGDEGPPLALFRQVAEALNVTLSDLFAEDRGAAHRYLIEMFDSLPILARLGAGADFYTLAVFQCLTRIYL